MNPFAPARRLNLAEKRADEAVIARLDEILKTENPCRIRVKDGRATCRAGTPCCSGCKHLGAGGCQVNSLACKFYFCPTAWAVLSDASKAELERLGAAYRGPLRNRHDGVKITWRRPPFIW